MKEKERYYSSILRVARIYSLEEPFKDVAKKAGKTRFRNAMDKLRLYAEFEDPLEQYVKEAIPIGWAEDALLSLSNIQSRTKPLTIDEVKGVGERLAWVIGSVREKAWSQKCLYGVVAREFYVKSVQEQLDEIRRSNL
jgi:hypothetical protein